MPDFLELERAAPDAIMAANARYKELAPTRDDLINSAVSVVVTDRGDMWMPGAVVDASLIVNNAYLAGRTLGYQSPRGHTGYLDAVVENVTGGETYPEEVVSVQTLGGTNAVVTARTFLELVLPTDDRRIIIDSGWANHEKIFKGWEVENKARVFNPANMRYDHGRYMSFLASAKPNTVVLLQSDGYNGDGMDRTDKEWNEVVETVAARDLIPIVDSAYQGLVREVSRSLYALNRLRASEVPTLLAHSNSKNMGMYNQRLGGMFIFNFRSGQRLAAQDALNSTAAREVFSSAPYIPAEIAFNVMKRPTMKEDYFGELGVMMRTIHLRRATFVDALGSDFQWLMQGRGLFATLQPEGFSPEQVKALEDQDVIALASSRINFGGIPTPQIGRVAGAIASIL